MNNKPTPPRWADRFLVWYCNPELLEEIQGDAHELYYERLQSEGKRAADSKYIWDVLRFLRLSNVKRTEEFNEPGFFGTFWNVNMKMAIRNSIRKPMIFIVKLSALAICLAFTFILTAFVINEFSYDHQYADYERIYRIGSDAEMQGKKTSYAVSPMPLGHTLAYEVPGIEMATRFITFAPHIEIGDEKFFDIRTFTVDSNFLKMFQYEFLYGSGSGLNDKDAIVLTESIAKRLYGTVNAVGKTLNFGPAVVEVVGVIKDLPFNTHMTFQALVSWQTFNRVDSWDDINGYSYIKLAPGVNIDDLAPGIKESMVFHLEEISEEYGFDAQPIIQRVDEIHLGIFLDEDFAPKRSKNYVYIILSVVILFLLTGLFNYLNLALAELTTQVKKIAVLRTFGGINADHRKVALTDVVLCLMIVAPLVVLIMYGVMMFGNTLPQIDAGVWTSSMFMSVVAGIVLLIIICASLNSFVISGSDLRLSPLKGKSTGSQKGITARKFLVAAQLSFSIIMIGLISVIVDQFHFVNEADKGFDDRDIVVIQRPGYRETKDLIAAIRGLSGVRTVAGASYFPGAPIETKDIFGLETSDGIKNNLVTYIVCDLDYPKLVGLRLKEGRLFDESYSTDKSSGYIINETAAREFGWADPLGKKIEGPLNSDGRSGEVIGVVEDFHFQSMHTRIQPVVIFVRNDLWGINFLYVKTEPMQSTGLIEQMQREYSKLLPEVPFDYSYLDARYRGLYQQDYEIRDIFRSGLIISILVSALGIFSISALLLSLREKEMGIRKVVGAANTQLFMMHLKPFATFFAIATVIGLPLIFYLSERWLNNFAYHINMSVWYFVLPGLITMMIILLASIYHAIRGALVNPVEILKNE